MITQEKFEIISKTIDEIFKFVQEDEDVKKDLQEYITTFQINVNTYAQLQSALLPYIFERRLGIERKSILELFKEKKGTQVDEKVVEGLSNSISSVFKINKILKNGFELDNLINEKDYQALAMVKMTTFRGVASGQYMIARIFPYEGEFYLIEINEIISSNDREKVLRLAVIRQMQDVDLIYADNEEKLKEIEELISTIGNKFDEFFGSNEIITTSKHVDSLIGYFNDFVENDEKIEKAEIESNIVVPEKFSYFEVKELGNNSYNFIENAAMGFASHSEVYDVGIVYEKELGLFVIPFYATFKQIFESENYSDIDGYKECIKNFLENPKIPACIIQKVSDLNPAKFLTIVNEVLETEYSLSEILHKFKKEHMERKLFSSTTVLYASKVFNELMGFVGQEKSDTEIDNGSIGRNDPCPCGSGKKYKKCCLQK